jgi:hypothetical protein
LGTGSSNKLRFAVEQGGFVTILSRTDTVKNQPGVFPSLTRWRRWFALKLHAGYKQNLKQHSGETGIGGMTLV